MTHTELKPCPFCGSDALSEWRDTDNDGGGCGVVECSKCYAEMSSPYVSWAHNDSCSRARSIEIASALWNRRHD